MDLYVDDTGCLKEPCETLCGPFGGIWLEAVVNLAPKDMMKTKALKDMFYIYILFFV